MRASALAFQTSDSILLNRLAHLSNVGLEIPQRRHTRPASPHSSYIFTHRSLCRMSMNHIYKSFVLYAKLTFQRIIDIVSNRIFYIIVVQVSALFTINAGHKFLYFIKFRNISNHFKTNAHTIRF